MSVTKTYLAGAIVLSVLLMSGCGGEPVLSCDEAQRYQLAVPGKRVVAPEGVRSKATNQSRTGRFDARL